MAEIDLQKLSSEVEEKYTVENNTFLATPDIRFSDWFDFSAINKAMIDTMLPAFCEKIKIFYSVVRMYFVDVVNDLIFREVASKVFFNYKSVFRNISLFISKRVFGRFNINISLTRGSLSTLPIIVFFSRIISIFSLVPRCIALSKFRHKIEVNSYKLSITDNRELSNLYR